MKIIKNNNKYILDFRFRDKRFRLTGFETERQSIKLADTIERLMEIYYSNDTMPLDMQRAVDCMPSRIVSKLGDMGMLSVAKTAGKNRLSDHLRNFIESLKVKQSTEKYLSLVENKIKRICDDCKFDVISDLDASRFTTHINSLNVAVKTKRDYIAVFKQFTKWLHDNGILTKNNFKLIKNPKVLKSNQVHPRRALTADEVAKLIKAAKNGETWRGISGAERALIYRLSVESGLRYNELKTLKVSDFDFENHTVEVRDINEKARRGDILQLKESTAKEIKLFLSNKTPQATAFTLKKGYLMIRRDLKAAKIKYEVDGRFADWHSLRHTTASLLIESGANPKTVQRIMRHSTADLTLSKYTHLYAGQVKDTIENLPDFNANLDKVLKTGTDDCIAENRQEHYCPKTANQSEKSRTIPNNSLINKTKGNSRFTALKGHKRAFSEQNVTSSFSTQKIGATGLEPATS